MTILRSIFFKMRMFRSFWTIVAALEREKSSKADTFSFFFVAKQVTERQWVKYDCTQVSAFLASSFTVSLINEPQRKGKNYAISRNLNFCH